VARGTQPTMAAPDATTGRNTARRLSIVVLPFDNIGGGPEQDYFVDGMTESLTSDLSRISGAFVIARNTAFTFKGKAVDVQQLGRELNVSYVLEGSVQCGANRLRISVQLIDAVTRAHLWTDRFEKPIADLFAMQDEIVSRIATALDAQLTVAEARRAERSPHPDATDLYFQGMASAFRGPAQKHLTEARGFFQRALALDPLSVGALVGLAFVDVSMGADLFTDNRAALLSAAETNVIKALSLAPNNATAHLILGYVYIFTDRAARGIAECEQALALNANLAGAHGAIGLAKMHMGHAAETESHILEAFRLSPRDIAAYWWTYCVGMAKLQLCADAEALDWLRRSIEINRNYHLAHFALAAALGLLGVLDEAQTAAKTGLSLNPGFTIRRLRDARSSNHPIYLAWRERLYAGLRLVGVPEG
jgi:TolB-like protein/tetratricopeptide (TPR) repeat protein